ncbi:hypothetical protein MMC08_004192 [Hypocenomyce scalaris]|nr:hypothetical protein [Hypocenomyce scalaris]
MHLQHLHLPSLTPYLRASAIQSHLVTAHLTYKTQTPALRARKAPPPPLLLTFQTLPTYTCGRREIGTLTPSQISHLKASGRAEFHEALRGGQTTFHGPGQLTAYLILDLLAHRLTPRTHIRLLEDSLIAACASYGIKGLTTENPGVWVTDDEKIASVGVHLRRNVASHGIGLNVETNLEWFDRIVACGLVGKRATSFEKLGVKVEGGVEEVGRVLAEKVARYLGKPDVNGGVDGVKAVDLGEVIEQEAVEATAKEDGWAG